MNSEFRYLASIVDIDASYRGDDRLTNQSTLGPFSGHLNGIPGVAAAMTARRSNIDEAGSDRPTHRHPTHSIRNMRKRRRCVLLMGLVMFCFFTIYFPILWSIRPEDEVSVVWNMTRNMHLLVRPHNVTIVLANREACRVRKPSMTSAGPNTEADDEDGNEEDLFLLVAVCSSVANFEARRAIRETWGRQGAVLPGVISGLANLSKPLTNVLDNSSSAVNRSSSEGTKLVTGGTSNSSLGIADFSVATNTSFRVIFMLGRTPNATLQGLVEAENRRYGDLVQEDFLDTYNNLTLKSVMLLKWVNESCRQASYVMKTDDDTFVNVPRLVRHLQQNGRTNLLLGCLICHARPVKNKHSKWYAPRVLFNERVYPKYLSGTGYVMSADLIPRLYEAALEMPFFHLEDIFVTGLCARHLQVRPVDYEGFTYQQRAPNPCLFHFGITGHRVAPSDFRAIWRKMWEPNLRCDRTKLRLRDFYSSKCV